MEEYDVEPRNINTNGEIDQKNLGGHKMDGLTVKLCHDWEEIHSLKFVKFPLFPNWGPTFCLQ